MQRSTIVGFNEPLLYHMFPLNNASFFINDIPINNEYANIIIACVQGVSLQRNIIGPTAQLNRYGGMCMQRR